MARTLQQVEGSLTTGGCSAAGRSRGDIQDQIIGGFHHGGALALESREGAEEVLALSPKFEFLRRQKAIFLLGTTWPAKLLIPSLGGHAGATAPRPRIFPPRKHRQPWPTGTCGRYKEVVRFEHLLFLEFHTLFVKGIASRQHERAGRGNIGMGSASPMTMTTTGQTAPIIQSAGLLTDKQTE